MFVTNVVNSNSKMAAEDVTTIQTETFQRVNAKYRTVNGAQGD